MSNNRNKILSHKYTRLIIFIILFLSSVLYLLSDRYLIEHIEAKITEDLAQSTDPADENKAFYDDWNYKSDGISINIERVELGSGKNKITYFAADVELKDSSYLHTAFAKNEFGRNIVEETSKIAQDNNAIFAINGDYYGFRSDGVLIRNSILYRDVPARTALAIYKDGTMSSFDENEIDSANLLKNGVIHTLSFGPVLVKDGKVADSFSKISIDTNFGNRSIQEKNPRTGIGIISANHFVFIVVDGRKENYSIGMSLSEFAGLFTKYCCIEAYNLDGGGSSTMYFMGRVVNNPLGKENERKISDILYIK